MILARNNTQAIFAVRLSRRRTLLKNSSFSIVVSNSVELSVFTLLLITGVSVFPHAERVNAVMQNMINKILNLNFLLEFELWRGLPFRVQNKSV